MGRPNQGVAVADGVGVDVTEGAADGVKLAVAAGVSVKVAVGGMGVFLFFFSSSAPGQGMI